jgi:hypothetical protein
MWGVRKIDKIIPSFIWGVRKIDKIIPSFRILHSLNNIEME